MNQSCTSIYLIHWFTISILSNCDSIQCEYFSFESESKHFSSDCGKSNTRKMTESIEDKLKNKLYRHHKEYEGNKLKSTQRVYNTFEKRLKPTLSQNRKCAFFH